jgi:ABC-type polysaccharide/polyol phosphate export permease
MRKVAEIYRYRELLKNLTINELKLRYRRSALGFLWTMLNPLLTMIVLSLVFSTVMRFNIKDYTVLLLAGLLPWLFFSQSVTNSLMSVVAKGDLLKKVYFPKALIPLSAVLACLLNFLLSLVPLFIVVAVLGHTVSPAMVFLPVAVVLMTLFACGFAFLFSCLNVFFRDFTHMTDVLLSAWFYLSPIIYRVDMVPDQFRAAFHWNPMLYLLECFRIPIYDGRFPPAHVVSIAAASAVVAFVAGFAIFVRFERHFILRV